jgi:hypothetical protein
MKFSKNHHRFFLLIGQFIGILFISNIISCSSCEDKSKGNSKDAGITMQIPSDPIIGDQKTVEVTFTLEDKAKTADLGNFTLEVTIKNEIGDVGSEISYGNNPKTTHINGSLKDISTVNALTAANPSCKVDINFLPAPKTKELELQIRLLNKTGEPVKEGTATWKTAPESVELSISRTTPEELKATQRNVNIEVKNKGAAAVEKGKLKLWIEREGGSNATIIGASQVNDTNVYTLDLPSMGAESTISYPMTIDPKEDQKFTLNFRPQYNGQDTATPFKVTWERGPELKIVEIKHDREGSNQVQVVVQNVGTSPAKNVEVTSNVTTKGATLDGSAKKAVKVDELQPGETKTIDNLGVLDFGKKGNKENTSAACEFGISCAAACPKAPAPQIVKQKVFIKAADIVFSFDIHQDADTGKVTYLIKNTGKDIAKGVKLEIKNSSSDPEGSLATLLNKKQEKSIVLGDLASGKKMSDELVLDLKDAEEATFEFNLIYDGESISEVEKTFKAKPLNLSLALITPIKNNAEEYILYGAENTLKLKIEQAHNSRSININHLELSIKVPAGDGTVVSQNLDGSAITELSGVNLGKLGDIITLYVNPKLEAQEANIRIELYYKKELVGTPVLVQWREYTMVIKDSGRLVGEQIGYFQIYGLSALDRDAITVSLESEKGTAFQFYDKMSGSTEATLADLAEYTQAAASNKASLEPIYFTINEKNGQTESTVNVVLRRKSKVIATHAMNWLDKGISVELKTNGIIYGEGSTTIVTIKNTGNETLKLSKVKARVTNTEDLPLSFGKLEGATIEGTLEDIIGNKELISQTQISVHLKANAMLKDKIATGVTLTLFEEKNGKEEMLVQGHIIYYTADIYNTHVQLGESTPENLSYISQQIVTNKDNPGYLAHLLTRLETGIEIANKILLKYKEIADNHSEFNGIIQPFYTILCDNIKRSRKLAEETKKAIAEFDNEEETIVQWANQSETKVNAALTGIKDSLEELKSLNGVKEINKFLIGKYNESKDLDQQSLQGLYEYYQVKSKQIEAFLTKRDATNLADTPSIKQIRALHNKMTSELPDISNTVKQTFDAGFEKVNDAIAKEQEKLEPAKVKRKSEKEVIQFYNVLVIQRNILSEWKDLLALKKELVTDSRAIQQSIAERYQTLAEKNKNFAKHIYEKNKPGAITRVAKLSVRIANDTFDVAQSTKNQTTEGAAIETAKAAVEASKDAIEAWGLFERTRGARKQFYKKPVQILDVNNDLNTLPTVLQDLHSNLDSLKGDEEKKKGGVFGRLFNIFSNNNKVNNNGENTDKDNINEEVTNREDTNVEDTNVEDTNGEDTNGEDTNGEGANEE